MKQRNSGEMLEEDQQTASGETELSEAILSVALVYSMTDRERKGKERFWEPSAWVYHL